MPFNRVLEFFHFGSYTFMWLLHFYEKFPRFLMHFVVTENEIFFPLRFLSDHYWFKGKIQISE